MNTRSDDEYDVVVIGAGISGLGAALELQKQGLKVCVLERCDRVGGRMTTDRMDGFAIDRGVTIFGAQFQRMRRLVKELGLQPKQQWFSFSFALRYATGQTEIRRTRIDRLLLSRDLTWKTKVAMARFTFDVLRLNRKLNHGHSPEVAHLDTESARDYMARLGGLEFLEKVLQPGLNGPLGGALDSNSKLILFQTFWNILLLSTWAVQGGMDQILEAMARQVTIVRNCTVTQVEVGAPCVVRAVVEGENKDFRTRTVVFAIPGHLVPPLCADLPREVLQVLEDTAYSRLTSAHVKLSRRPDTKVSALGMACGFASGHEIELEHNRVGGLCPEGQGMASVYFWDHGDVPASQRSDAEIESEANVIVKRCFPECCNSITGVHILRWPAGIARFPVGRLAQMTDLRQRISNWDLPVQLCGDYLDGISSEGALVTGQQAALNAGRYLRTHG